MQAKVLLAVGTDPDCLRDDEAVRFLRLSAQFVLRGAGFRISWFWSNQVASGFRDLLCASPGMIDSTTKIERTSQSEFGHQAQDPDQSFVTQSSSDTFAALPSRLIYTSNVMTTSKQLQNKEEAQIIRSFHFWWKRDSARTMKIVLLHVGLEGL